MNPRGYAQALFVEGPDLAASRFPTCSILHGPEFAAYPLLNALFFLGA